jgi:hypothetical protein
MRSTVDLGGGHQGQRTHRFDGRFHLHQHPAHIGEVNDRETAAILARALQTVFGVLTGLLVSALGNRQALQADALAGVVHHGEHAGQAHVRLADQITDRAFRIAESSSRRSGCHGCPVCVPGRCTARYCARPAGFGIEQELGTTNSEMPLTPAGASGKRARTKCTTLSVIWWSPQVMKIFWPVIK